MCEPRVIRLLVVEDNRAYSYLIQRAFSDRETRWELMLAEDGEQAVRILFTEERKSEPLPDLILLDWNLPKLSGNQVLQRLKGHLKLRRIPVLVFSSSTEDTDVHAAYDYHANGFIPKPQDVKMLALIVETIERFWVAVAHLPRVTR